MEANSLIVLLFSLSSCGSSKKILIESKTHQEKKNIVKLTTPKKQKQQSIHPIKVMTNKEKIIAYVEQYAPIAQKEMNLMGFLQA